MARPGQDALPDAREGRRGRRLAAVAGSTSSTSRNAATPVTSGGTASTPGSVSIGDFTQVDQSHFIVIERDNEQGATARIKRIYEIDLNDVGPDGSLVKTLAVDLMNISDPTGISLLSARPGDVGLGHHVLVSLPDDRGHPPARRQAAAGRQRQQLPVQQRTEPAAAGLRRLHHRPRRRPERRVGRPDRGRAAVPPGGARGGPAAGRRLAARRISASDTIARPWMPLGSQRFRSSPACRRPSSWSLPPR